MIQVPWLLMAALIIGVAVLGILAIERNDKVRQLQIRVRLFEHSRPSVVVSTRAADITPPKRKTQPTRDQLDADVISALRNLGFASSLATQQLETAKADPTVKHDFESLLRACLRRKVAA